MEKSVAVFAMLHFFIMGLSHLLQHQGWREFFAVLHSHGRAGAFANGFLTLFMGSIIVSFHDVWNGVPLVLTLIGWSYLIKSASIFLFPDWNVRSLQSVQTASALKFRIAGVGLLVLAATLAWCLVFDVYE